MQGEIKMKTPGKNEREVGNSMDVPIYFLLSNEDLTHPRKSLPVQETIDCKIIDKRSFSIDDPGKIPLRDVFGDDSYSYSNSHQIEKMGPLKPKTPAKGEY
ncbi:hypothetical protein AYI68_g4831 [Smittium mucronatum]|uniref:Uncharacterized protein n=1 Tax=Smittium mucronatum TaxID=133383 RepID=A0A1R0GW08_9FUNG|nr:hypothetical protein AYI68_g4831 [Smittium mucronatum]